MLLAPSPLVPSPTILANGTRVVGASAVGGGISLHRSTITADNFLFLEIVEGTIEVLKSSSPVEIEFIVEEEVSGVPCKVLDSLPSLVVGFADIIDINDCLAIVEGTTVVLKSSSPVEFEFIAEEEVSGVPCKLLDSLPSLIVGFAEIIDINDGTKELLGVPRKLLGVGSPAEEVLELLASWTRDA